MGETVGELVRHSEADGLEDSVSLTEGDADMDELAHPDCVKAFEVGMGEGLRVAETQMVPLVDWEEDSEGDRVGERLGVREPVRVGARVVARGDALTVTQAVTEAVIDPEEQRDALLVLVEQPVVDGDLLVLLVNVVQPVDVEDLLGLCVEVEHRVVVAVTDCVREGEVEVLGVTVRVVYGVVGTGETVRVADEQNVPDTVAVPV